MRIRPAVAVSVVALALAACATQEDTAEGDGDWVGTVSTEGNVTTVRNESGSVWGSVELVEEASIGTLDGNDAYVFAQVASLVADDRRIYVLDRVATIVRVYDLAGRHLFDIGGPGDGPGEFRRPWVLGLTNEPRLIVRDIGQGRIHEFSPDNGELLADWRAPGGAPTTVTDEGFAWVYGRLPNGPDGEFRFGMIARTPTGATGKSVPLPLDFVDEPFVPVDRRMLELAAMEARAQGLSFNVNLIPFAAQQVWALGRDGTLFVGAGETYEFAARHLDGSELRVARSVEPVAVAADEARWLRARLTEFWRQLIPEFVWAGAEIPATKRFYMDLIPDQSGRVWVLRELAGERVDGCELDPDELDDYVNRPCWRQLYALDAFGAAGRFLGSIDLPAEMRVDIEPYIRDDLMVAVAEDQVGTVMVKRYRLVLRP